MDADSLTKINSTIHLTNLIRAQYSPGPIALPASSSVYTRLRHVQGVPTQTPGGGYSVSKLRMIDLLVDRLVHLRGEPMDSVTPRGEAETNALLIDYASQLSSALGRSNAVAQSYTAGVAEPGVVIDLVA